MTETSDDPFEVDWSDTSSAIDNHDTVTICVFCGARENVPAEYRVLARELGQSIALRGWHLVYGAGSIGLMGDLAGGALERGGRVTGVIPHRLAEVEVMLPGLHGLVQTETLRQRKAIMDSASDAFVILAGGLGTLEELVEILTLKQLGFHDRPIILLDPFGFWDELLQLHQKMVRLQFAHQNTHEMYAVTADVTSTLSILEVATERSEKLGAVVSGAKASLGEHSEVFSSTSYKARARGMDLSETARSSGGGPLATTTEDDSVT